MQINERKRPFQRKKVWSNKPERYYQSSDWKRKVDAVWERDKGLCQLCLQEGKMHQLIRGTKDRSMQGTIDHPKQRKLGGSDSLDNLWLIGTNHHDRKSAMEGNNMRRTK